MNDGPALWAHASAWWVLGGAFALAVPLGALLARTRYCSLGAITDWLLLGDTRRARMWLAAAGTALIGTGLLELASDLDLNETLVRYASPHFAWPRFVVGGLMFGIGMQLASGCASRQWLRLGGGSLKAATSAAVAAACAAWLIDGGGYRQVFAPLFDAAAVAFTGPPRLGHWLALATGQRIGAGHLALATGGALILVATVTGSCRPSRLELLGGLGLGLAVVAGWWLTGGAPGRLWQEDMAFLDSLPRGVGTQSYAFVAPLADALACAAGKAPTFGLLGALGLLAGSALWHWRAGRWRLERHRDARDVLRSVFGGALLGVGGVLAMGCTVGQGVTGLSTLAAGSVLATLSTVAGVVLAVTLEYRYAAVD